MPEPDEVVGAIAEANWNDRVGLIRRIPEDFGSTRQVEIYSRVAEQVYVPHLTPDFAYVP